LRRRYAGRSRRSFFDAGLVERRLSLRLGRQGGDVLRVRVRDAGIGLAPTR
jgi:hypothetical protein